MKKPPKPVMPANPPMQANAAASGGDRLRPFLPPSLLTSPTGVRKASTQKRTLIGGSGA